MITFFTNNIISPDVFNTKNTPLTASSKTSEGQVRRRGLNVSRRYVTDV